MVQQAPMLIHERSPHVGWCLSERIVKSLVKAPMVKMFHLLPLIYDTSLHNNTYLDMFVTDITEYKSFVCCCPHGIEMYTISIVRSELFPSILPLPYLLLKVTLVCYYWIIDLH